MKKWKNVIIGTVIISIFGLCWTFLVPGIKTDKLEGDVEVYLIQPGTLWEESQELQVSNQIQKYKISDEQTVTKRELMEELKKIKYYRSVKAYKNTKNNIHKSSENETKELIVSFQYGGENKLVKITKEYIKIDNKCYKIWGDGEQHIKNILKKNTQEEENIFSFLPENKRIERIFLLDRWYLEQENINKITDLMQASRKMDIAPEDFESDVTAKEIMVVADGVPEFISYYEFGKVTYFITDYGVYALNNEKENYFRKFMKALPISTENPEEELQEYPCGIEKECVVLTREEMPEILPLEDFSVYENLKLLPEEIQKVLYEEGTFFEVYNQKEYTKNNFDGTHYMDLEPFEAPEWLEYMVFDFDHDGERELAVVLKPVSSGEGVEIFDVQEGKVYAYSVVYRGFLRPQTDGTVTGSSGASVSDQYYFEFDKNQVREKMIAQQDVQDYQIGTQKVSEDEYYKFLEERYWQTEIEIPWSSKTLDEVLLE